MYIKLTSNLDNLQPLCEIHTKVLGLLLLERLLLRLHNIRQLHEPGLIQPQIRRNNQRKLRLNRLNTTIHLLNNLDAIALAKLDLARLRSLTPTQKPREHLARLPRIVVDALLAQYHEVALLLLDNLLKDLGDAEGLEVLALGELDVDGAVGAHGHRRADDLLRLGRAGREDADVLDAAGGELTLSDSDGFFYGDVVEGVDRVLNAGCLDTGEGLVDTGLDL